MMIRNQNSLLKLICVKRSFGAQAAVSVKVKDVDHAAAKGFEEIPSLSRFELIKRFMPGGKFHNKSVVDTQRMLRDELGTIFKMPGMFGQNTMVTTFDADDIESVHRNEGAHPFRRGMETLKYYRDKIRPDIFDVGGLIVE